MLTIYSILSKCELARWEIIIARVVTELIPYTRAELRIEYLLKVSNQLQGNIDYRPDETAVVAWLLFEREGTTKADRVLSGQYGASGEEANCSPSVAR